MASLRYWLPALLWLPGGIIAEEVLRAGSVSGMMAPASLVELAAVAPCGLPLALACRRLARSGYPGPALVAWLALGGAAVAGFFGPLPSSVQALLVSLPVWVAAWRVERRPRGPGLALPREWRGRSPGRFLLRALSESETPPRRSRFRQTP